MITAKANDTANASIAQDTADKARKEEEKRQYDKLVDDLNAQKNLANEDIKNSNNKIAVVDSIINTATAGIQDIKNKIEGYQTKSTNIAKLIDEARNGIKANTAQLEEATKQLNIAQAQQGDNARQINEQNNISQQASTTIASL